MTEFKHNEHFEFINQISVKQIIEMFDLLPDVLFWVKNTHSHIIYVNKAFLSHQGLTSMRPLLGKTDTVFAPHYLARQYIADDKKVMAGEVITERLELNILRTGGYGWFSTSKRPLKDNEGNIIGTYGTTQHLQKTSHLLATIDAISVPVEYVREHFAQEITVQYLAEISFLSVSALERRFKKHLGKTPKQFINQVRLEHARKRIMETSRPIYEIAEESGFTDNSYFCKQFKTLFAIQPSKLRVQMLSKV